MCLGFFHSSPPPDPIPVCRYTTCCRHHPCLDILQPTESDVLIFVCGRGLWDWRRRWFCGWGGLLVDCFSPSCLHIYLCPFTSHPLGLCAWLEVCECVCALFFFFFVTLLRRRTPSTWAESRACCDCAWALICQALIPQRRRDVSFCLLALLHISMWHINMSQRIKCCSRAFLSPKYLHAALCMCIFVCQGGKLAN